MAFCFSYIFDNLVICCFILITTCDMVIDRTYFVQTVFGIFIVVANFDDFQQRLEILLIRKSNFLNLGYMNWIHYAFRILFIIVPIASLYIPTNTEILILAINLKIIPHKDFFTPCINVSVLFTFSISFSMLRHLL